MAKKDAIEVTEQEGIEQEGAGGIEQESGMYQQAAEERHERADGARLKAGVRPRSGTSEGTVESRGERYPAHESRITSDERTLDSETAALQQPGLQEGSAAAVARRWPRPLLSGCAAC